jgi:N6-L-threonylcarbamoyladenine synthase
MRILSIETSCDETALSVVAVDGTFPNATYTLLGNSIFSQIDIHREYGGVFPNLAKREHVRRITPLFERTLAEANLLEKRATPIEDPVKQGALSDILAAHEPELADALYAFYTTFAQPDIDLISVTAGPGLEPALWVGVNFAKALATLYEIPIVPANHMEGHILASMFNGSTLADLAFPALVLLISGGHTEFVLMRDWHTYEKVGQTRDDAVGEAFDKVARLLGLPYPGGPEISRLADRARAENLTPIKTLPRPMLDSGDLDFSFSGLKTAVRYAVADRNLTEDERAAMAREFEDAATDVLIAKGTAAIEQYGVHSFLIGGGVSANRHIRAAFRATLKDEYPDIALFIPEPSLATDNSIMIALAGHANEAHACSPREAETIRADGNLAIGERL